MAVFEEGWVDAVQRRYENLPKYQRPDIYFIAIGEDWEIVRQEVEQWVSYLPPEEQKTLVPQLRNYTDPEQFIETYNTLAVGAFLRDELGFHPEYEVAYGKLNPDWTVLDKGKRSKFVVEVFTDNPPKSDNKYDWRWGSLTGWLRRIPLGYGLSIKAPFDAAPDDKEAKSIAGQIGDWLNTTSPPVGDKLTHGPIEFEIIVQDGNLKQVETLGPTRWFTVNTEALRKKVLKKVDKYKPLGKSGIPFVVAIVPNMRTGRGSDTFDDVFLGQEAALVKFDSLGRAIGAEATRIADGLLSPENEFLSAAFWVRRVTGGEFLFRVVHNPHAINTLPPNIFSA